MKKNLAISGLIIMLAIFSCGENKTGKTDQTSNVKYYRQIMFSETNFDNITGIYEMTAEQAKTVNNYKFTYDEKGRPIKIEYCRDSVLLGYGSTEAARILIEYTDSTETRTYFDKDNQPQEIEGKVFKSVYSLDKTSGLRTGLKFYGKDGNLVENRNKIAYYTWAKLPDGMIKENRYNLENKEVIMNEFCPFYELRFTYNDKGHVMRMANYQADTLYNCTAENCGDIGVSYFSFVMSDKGDLKEFSVHNTTGRFSNLYWGWAKFVNQADSLGYVTERAFWDQDQEYLSGKKVPVRQYKYDDHGAIIEEITMNGNREIINDPNSGIAIREFKYNELGQPTDTLNFDNKRVEIKKKG
ncbi:MAG: hypothetical protein U0W24_07390 [Bacteroidales bacterium]